MGGATSGPRRTRRRWSEEDKRAIVTETAAPGASIAAVARQHSLNTNLLHGWRRLYGSSAEASTEPVLLPVDVAEDTPVERPVEEAPRRPRRPDQRQGVIEIELPCGARLRCDHHVDRRALTLVIDVLMTRA